MLTKKQNERAQKIVEERRELEARGKLNEMLLDFWEMANQEFKERISHITSLDCIRGEWTYVDENQHKSISEPPENSYIKEVFEKLKKIPQKDLYSLKGSQSEWSEIGFSLCIIEGSFSMKINY